MTSHTSFMRHTNVDICTLTCTHVYTHIYVHVDIHTSIHTHTYIYIHIYMQMCSHITQVVAVHTHIYIHTYVSHTHIYTYISHTHIYTYIYICKCAHTQGWTCRATHPSCATPTATTFSNPTTPLALRNSHYVSAAPKSRSPCRCLFCKRVIFHVFLVGLFYKCHAQLSLRFRCAKDPLTVQVSFAKEPFRTSLLSSLLRVSL